MFISHHANEALEPTRVLGATERNSTRRRREGPRVSAMDVTRSSERVLCRFEPSQDASPRRKASQNESAFSQAEGRVCPTPNPLCGYRSPGISRPDPRALED
ncbi:unnamed protein product [Lota lota]